MPYKSQTYFRYVYGLALQKKSEENVIKSVVSIIMRS